MNVLELAGRHVQLRRVSSTNGGEYQGPCPACGDGGKSRKSDRFHVWPAANDGQGSYWCRQCGKAGDAIQFLRDFEGMGFREACEHLRIDVPERMKYQAPRVSKHARGETFKPEPTLGVDNTKWEERATSLMTWASDNLHNDPERTKWLAHRGINEITAKSFRLGWNPGEKGKDAYRPRETWGLPTELKENGRKKALWIPRGLVIPWRDAKGKILRIRIRRPEGEPRYYVIPGSAMACMIMPRQRHRAYVVVESELDGILLDQTVSDLCGVVALGNSSRKPDAHTHLAISDAGRLLIALDYDKAGAKAVEWWLGTYPQAKPWPVPKGKDPGEAFQAGVDLREWIVEGLPRAWGLRP